ncbi:ribokinase [Leifsonia aquatica]|uniref:ribokinase n=1 Tax=Leifsonia aquatica TaxID=144185 RepID=UPI000B25A2DE|nr:ribokinase [Leifsonia aquatica]
MTLESIRIAVVGSYGAGLTMRVPRSPDAGETVSGGVFDSGPGGKGSNQAVAAARLGAQVSLLTAVGADDFGRAAHELWAREGVDASRTLTGTGATMVGFILVEPTGENRIAIAPGALDELGPAAVDAFRDEIAAADILIVSMEIPLDAVVHALRTAKEVGTTTLLNPAPARALPDDAWPLIDIITPNQTEAPVLLGRAPGDGTSEQELVAALRARTGGAVLLTRGAAGALLSDADGEHEIPPVPPVAVVDTTGAGDSFTAALAVAVAAGAPLADAAAYAAHAGAHTVAAEGVVPALPTAAQLPTLPNPGSIGPTR